MNMNKKNIVRKLLMLVVAVLLLSSVVTEANAAPPPSSGTLTIHYYALEDMRETGLPNNGNEAEVPSGAVPLTAVEFTVWQVDPVMAASVTSAAEAWQYILESTGKTGMTNASGAVTFTLDQGLYYVAESNSGTSQQVVPTEPFLVSVSMEDPVTGAWITDVHAYPKSQSIAIDKFVGATGTTDYDAVSKDLPVAVGEYFNWYIRAQIPGNIGTGDTESFRILDPLDAHFDYLPGSLAVYIMPESQSDLAECTVLKEGVDYTINFDTVTNTLAVELTAGGTVTVKELVAAGNRYCVTAYSSAVNASAPHGIALYSGATLEYTRTIDPGRVSADSSDRISVMNLLAETNGSETVKQLNGNETTKTTTAAVAEKPEVHTGKVAVTKLADKTGKALAGAEFGIAKSKADALAGKFIATKTSDANGELTFYGLKYGLAGDGSDKNSNNTTFWLVETKAPDGYRLLENPEEVTFHYQQDAENGEYYFAKATVYNVWIDTPTPKTTSSFSLNVKTGDSNAIRFFGILAGLSLVVLVVLWIRKRKSVR